MALVKCKKCGVQPSAYLDKDKFTKHEDEVYCSYCYDLLFDKNGERHSYGQSPNLEKLKIKTTTGFNFETHHITKYLDVISAEVVMGTGMFSELDAGLSDLFGTKGKMFSDKLKKARLLVMDELKGEAVDLGANAIIGIDYDFNMFRNNIIGIVVTGTAVVIEGKEIVSEQNSSNDT